ncbi:MAG: ABC transporter substrate-binding protein [Candidatus Velthaea sp.]|jgi:branched-chain amino acid transport system substrate-binding protein
MKRKNFLATSAAAGALVAAPRFALAAGNAATVKIGFLDSFSGVFSDIAGYHKVGALLALADANKRGRVNYEFAFGDDTSKPAVATTEVQRLVSQENVDVIFGGTSSGAGLALNAKCLDLGVFDLALGPLDSSITGAKAGKATFRFSPSGRMLYGPLAQRVLAQGKKWYFIQADYAFGKDGYNELSAILQRAGGTEVGHDVLALGTSDFSSALTKVRNSDADVLMMCLSGQDAANCAKQYVDFGLNKKLKLGGINLEDFYYKAIALDTLVGATFPVSWSPLCCDDAQKLTKRLQRDIPGPISWRHYYGYVGLESTIARINDAGTTSAEKLVAAFSGSSFNAYKPNKATYRASDHQLQQDVFSGAIVSSKTFAKTQFMFEIVSTLEAPQSDGPPTAPWVKAAETTLGGQTIGARPGYTPKTW